MSLRKRDNLIIKVALDSRAARFNVKKKELINNRHKSASYKLELKKQKRRNLRIRSMIQKRHKNLSNERRTINFLKELEEDGKKLVNQEKLELEKKREDANIVRLKKDKLSKEIAKLENVLIKIQKDRLGVDEQNHKLEELTIEREEEIQILEEKVKEKDREIAKNRKIYLELRKNIDQIIETAIEL